MRGLARIPVPPPADPRTWRSPLRGTWLTSVFGAVLLVGLPIVILTGLMSYIAYGPQFGQAIPGDVGYLHLPFFDWPSNPSWFYRLTQGLHVTLGMVLTPVVLAKLWSVVPKLFVWPPVRSLAQLLERISLLALVGGILFEFVTGLMNSQYDYSWGFGFYTAHYYGAWVFIAGFVTHVAIKLPTMLRALRAGPGRHRRARALAARLPRRDRARADRPHGARGAGAEHGVAEPTRAAGDGRRRQPAGRGAQHRADLGRPAAPGAALSPRPVLRRPARTTSRSTARSPGPGSTRRRSTTAGGSR